MSIDQNKYKSSNELWNDCQSNVIYIWKFKCLMYVYSARSSLTWRLTTVNYSVLMTLMCCHFVKSSHWYDRFSSNRRLLQPKTGCMMAVGGHNGNSWSSVHAYHKVSTNIASQWSSDIERSGFFVSAESRQDVVVQHRGLNLLRSDKTGKIVSHASTSETKAFRSTAWLDYCDSIRLVETLCSFFRFTTELLKPVTIRVTRASWSYKYTFLFAEKARTSENRDFGRPGTSTCK